MADDTTQTPLPDAASMVNSPAPPENLGVPEPSVPSNVQQSANVTTQPQQQMDTIPSAPLTQNVQDPTGGLFSHILQVIAGNPVQGGHIDQATGKPTGTPITGKGDLAAHIVAGALAGMFRGMGAPPGPGHIGEAGAAGFNGAVQDRMRSQALQQQQFENENQAQLQKIQVAHANAQLQLTMAQTHNMNQETYMKQVDFSKPLINAAVDSGQMEDDGAGNAKGVPWSQLQDDIKSGKADPTSSMAVVVGTTSLGDGTVVPLFGEIKNPNAQVPVTQDMLDSWKNGGVNVPAALTPGTTIALKSAAFMTNQAQVSVTADNLVKQFRDYAKGDDSLLSALPGKLDVTQPGVLNALNTFNRAMMNPKAPGDPFVAIKTVEATNPVAGRILTSALGGEETLTKLQNKYQSDTKAAADAAATKANQAALQPFKEEDQRFQRDLQTSAQIAQKELSDNLETNKDARDKVTTNVVKPYLDKMSDINMTNAALDQAGSNPVAARAVIFKLVGVSQPTGSHRVMPIEIDAFRYPGGVAQRSVEQFKNFLLGQPWTPEATQAAKAFVNGQQSAAEVNLKHGVNVVNGTYGTHINAGSIIGSGYTAPTPDQVVRSGQLNGQTVYQLKDGSTVDYAGRPVNQ